MQIKSFLQILFLLIAASFISLVVFTAAYYFPIAYSEDKLLHFKETGIVLEDRNSTPFYYINNPDNNTYTPSNKIASNLKKAVVASEDRTFYSNFGVDPVGILRSLYLNLKTQSFSYGGSTITQQLVKNTLLSSKKSMGRKLQEVIISLYIDKRYPKDKILEMYLNTVYFGEGAYGIADASHTFFGKDPDKLNIAESAYLAASLNSPSIYSPFTGDVNLGKEAQKKVIAKMFRANVISLAERDIALGQPLNFVKKTNNRVNSAPHFALMVEDELKKKYGDDVIYDGLTVKTTLNLQWQKYAEEAVKEQVNRNSYNGVSNGAAVVMSPLTGQIFSLVGSKDWSNDRFGKVNMAITPRQPGSSFKPIVYSIALENRIITPATILSDIPRNFGNNYKPKDYDNKYRGKVTVRRALANSLNIPAVEVMQMVGVPSVLSKAIEFGITTLGDDPSQYGPSLVLGAGEIPLIQMVDAYTAFANEGTRVEPESILEIRNKYNDVIFKSDPVTHSVIEKSTAYLISSILSDSKTRAEEFGSILNLPFPAAVKTGTTENYRDAWTIGYTPDLVIGVWVGNNDNRPMRNQSGSLAASPIWKDLIKEFSSKTHKNFQRPSDVLAIPFCSKSASMSARIEYFVQGTQPARDCVILPSQNFAAANDDKKENIVGSEQGDAPSITQTPTPTTTVSEQNKEKHSKSGGIKEMENLLQNIPQ